MSRIEVECPWCKQKCETGLKEYLNTKPLVLMECPIECPHCQLKFEIVVEYKCDDNNKPHAWSEWVKPFSHVRYEMRHCAMCGDVEHRDLSEEAEVKE